MSKIPKYLVEQTNNILGIEKASDMDVQKIGGGDYNLNYSVSLKDGRNFLMRLNVEPQSGLENQIEYEYKTLQFLSPLGITPRPYYLDNSKKYFPYGLLIEEFLQGKALQFAIDSLKRTAHTLAKLHTIQVSEGGFMRWDNPLREQFNATANSLNKYEQRKTVDKEIVSLGKKVIAKAEMELSKHEKDFSPKSLIHSDLVPSNFIDTGSKVYLFDWEKARLDDPSYDIAVLFSRLANLWDSPRVLTQEEKEAFLKTYIDETGDHSIEERMLKRLALFTLIGTLWAAGRICDVEEGVISKELGAQNYERYKKIIDFGELKKFI